MTTQKRSIYMLSLAFVALVIFFATPGLAAQKVVNKDKTPLVAVNLTNLDGSYRTACICIPPQGEMVFGDNGWPIHGAGYIEAVADRTFYIGFRWQGKFGGIRVKKIEWDESGKTVSISGLSPVFEGEQKVKILSDLSKPKIINGILYLRFEGNEDNEYRLKIEFGKGIAIYPDDL